MGLTRKAAFYTLGCKVNQYETENIKKQFLERGYEEENFENCAEMIGAHKEKIAKLCKEEK